MIHDERRSIRSLLGIGYAFRLHDEVMVPAAGTIRDVSRQGCCLETTDDLAQPDDVIEIHFDAPVERRRHRRVTRADVRTRLR